MEQTKHEDAPLGFYTQKGYQLKHHPSVTGAMEDYLEMICRLAGTDGHVRMNTLADRLNVRPSSASKMVGQLRGLELVAFEKYGLISPTAEGRRLGAYLLHRHDVLQRFFRLLNGRDDVLEQVEQVEHCLDADTVRNLEQLLARLEGTADGPAG